MKSHIASAKTSQTGSANAQTPKTTSQLTSRPFAPISKQTISTPNPHQQQEQTEGLLQRKTNLLEILDLTAETKKLPEVIQRKLTNGQSGSSEFAQRIKAKGVQQSKGHQKPGISAIQRQPMLSDEMQPQESLETNSSVKERVDFPTQSIQAKLKVGAPGDKYEQEADALASQVMSMPELESVATKPVNASIQREILPKEKLVQSKQLLQCKSDRSIQSLDNIESHLNSSKGGGSPLSSNVRGFMEPRLRTNLKNVRVHTGSEAVQMSRELGAEAFTHGSDIYYGSGKSPDNDELTAHELTHVMQQTGAVQSQYNLQKTSLVQLTKDEAEKSKPLVNPLVKDIQQKLNSIQTANPFLSIVCHNYSFGDDYDILKVDGIYGDQTKQAVEMFQALSELMTGIPLEQDRQLNVLTRQAIDKASSGLKARSLLIKEIQLKLKQLNLFKTFDLEVNGLDNNETRNAIKIFQRLSQVLTGIPLKVGYEVNELTVKAIDEAINLEKPASLKANELILTTAPGFTNDEFLEKYKDEVKQVLKSWNMDYGLPSVQLKPILFGSEKKQAIILKWNASWGEKPISTAHYDHGNLNPIEAKVSVAWLHKLAGWGKLDSSEQTILDNMLGGETNLLSKNARDVFKSRQRLDGLSDTKQVEKLREFMTGKDTIPRNVDEPITTTKVEYILRGPTEQKNYPFLTFRSRTADAESWIVEFKDSTDFEIIAPKAPEPGYHNHTAQEIADSASYLPKANRSLLKTIILYPLPSSENDYYAAKYKIPGFEGYMSTDKTGVVTIYGKEETKPLQPENYRRTTLIHETGHIWSEKTWGTDTSKGKWLEWQKMMDADKVSVSGYAMAEIEEDFSETLTAYVGTKNSPAFDEYRQIVPNRFAMLDKEYK